MEKILFEVNLYATQVSNKRRFIPTKCDEIKTFFEINLMPGLTRKSGYKFIYSDG